MSPSCLLPPVACCLPMLPADAAACHTPASPRFLPQVWLVLGDCTLIGLAPVLVHMAKDAQGHYAFRCGLQRFVRA